MVTGEWTGEIDSPSGLMQFSLEITGGGDALAGTFSSELGSVNLRGSQAGADVTLSGTWTPPGGTARAVTLTGRVAGDDLSGTITAQGMSPFAFKARRRGPGAFQEESR
jgi:hypothetical protein